MVMWGYQILRLLHKAADGPPSARRSENLRAPMCSNSAVRFYGVIMLKAIYVSVVALPLAFAVPATFAEQTGQHMGEAAQADPELSAEFQRVMRSMLASALWVESYGTTSPSTAETMDGRAYEVYWGCKPHDCVSESYVVMYSPADKTIVAGAFVRNRYEGPDLAESRITWLGKTEFDAARVLGKYLY